MKERDKERDKVIISYLNDEWAVRNAATGHAIAICRNGETSIHPPHGDLFHSFISEKSIAVLKQGEYQQMDLIMFSRDERLTVQQRKDLFDVYRYCKVHAPYTSKQKAGYYDLLLLPYYYYYSYYYEYCYYNRCYFD